MAELGRHGLRCDYLLPLPPGRGNYSKRMRQVMFCPLQYIYRNSDAYHPWVNAKHLLSKYAIGYLSG